MAIEKSLIQGEPDTGYEGPEGGPFACHNCEYFREDGSCGQKTMMAKSQQPRTRDGRVVVDPDGCCEYIERPGSEQAEDQDDDETPGARFMTMGTQ